jgi:phospholipase C
MPTDNRFTRREVLKAGLGLSALAASMPGCGSGSNRCAGGPVTSADAQSLLSGIDTLVVVMLENRSFDHLFGALRMDPAYPARGHVDGLTGTESNPDLDGWPVRVEVAGDVEKIDPKHDWDASHRAFNGGRNDGFVIANAGPNQAEVMSYHDRATAPLFYALADEYVVCDRWFASVMGPTWPNRFYLHAGTAAGRKKNWPMGLTAPSTVWERMADRCYRAKNYYAGAIPWYSVAFPTKSWSGDDAVIPEPIDRFFRDAERGELPSFSLIDPDFRVNDAHPPYGLRLAEAFLASIHRALAASIHWPRSLLVIVFDEHGGFFDHVSPPTVPDPDPEFRRIGFRVAALVIGPSVRKGAIVSTPFDHVSILATLATRFGIASLGPRMDAARDLSACIDPERSQGPLPPQIEVRASVLRTAALRPTSQPEIEALAASRGVPPGHADPRRPEERFRAWLRHAEALEAIRVVR